MNRKMFVAYSKYNSCLRARRMTANRNAQPKKRHAYIQNISQPSRLIRNRNNFTFNIYTLLCNYSGHLLIFIFICTVVIIIIIEKGPSITTTNVYYVQEYDNNNLRPEYAIVRQYRTSRNITIRSNECPQFC